MCKWIFFLNFSEFFFSMNLCVLLYVFQEAYSVARQFNLIPPVCEQAEYHMFQREKVEVQLPELFHKIGVCVFSLEKRHFNTVVVMVAGS